MQAYIRTLVPIIAGGIITYFLSFGIELDEGFVTFSVMAIVQFVYYLVARVAGKKLPMIEAFMLGSSKTPTYK